MTLKLKTQEYRKFGVSVGFAFVLLLGFVIPWLLSRPIPRWPFIIGAPLMFFGLVFPQALKPIYIVWMKAAEALGWFNTRVILGVFFFLVITPFAFFIKVFRKDLLGLRLDTGSKTYWQNRDPASIQQYDRPF